MNSELFFIYDSHCPWSYATTQLVNEIVAVYPEMTVNLWHTAHYDGSDSPGQQQVDAVSKQTAANFGKDYTHFADAKQDATMTANVMAWMQYKQPEKALDVLNALQKEHFIEGNALNCAEDFETTLTGFKLSPPKKVFKNELSKEAEYTMGDIAEMQELTQTSAFPALMLAVDEQLVLLNHNLYLTKPSAIIEAVKLEMKNT
ncbi:protein-disulfide isomerase [Colwelliaceae bacterium BS250]